MTFFTVIGIIVVALMALAAAIALSVAAYSVAENNTRTHPRIAMLFTVLAAISMPMYLLGGLSVYGQLQGITPSELAPFIMVLAGVSTVNIAVSVSNERKRQSRFA